MNPIIRLLSLPLQNYLPPQAYDIDPNAWISTHSLPFNIQWIQCTYPISGQYGQIPRYVYYCFVVIAVLLRSRTWIATTIMASIMTYSGAAAVHALILVSLRQRLLSSGSWAVEFNGNHPWFLPIRPQVWDTDTDGVTAIVGVGFLVLAPMQVYSSTFQRSGAKAILLLWSVLLLAGLVSALISSAYIGVYDSPQLRFCPLDFNETLPITKSPYNTPSTERLVGSPDWHLASVDWNATIWNVFTDPSSRRFSTCIYPCFSTSWPLRDDSEIIVTAYGNPTNSDTGWYLDFAIFTQIIASGVCTITIFVLKCFGWYQRQRSSLGTRFTNALQARPFFAWKTAKRYGLTCCTLHFIVLDAYAKYGSPIALVCFAAWIEWQLWYDSSGEDFRHVGQWGALVAAGLLLIAALVGRYSGKVTTIYTAYAAERSVDARNGLPRLYTLKAVLGLRIRWRR